MNPMSAPQQARGDLRLDVKSVGAELERPRHVPPHDLVAGFHVGERSAEQQVRHAGENPIRHERDERRACASPEKPGAVHHVGGPAQNRLDQVGELLRIELQIGVLDCDDRSPRMLQSETDGRAFAAVSLGMEHYKRQALADCRIQHLSRSIRRTVVNDDDFSGQRKMDSEEPIEHGS